MTGSGTPSSVLSVAHHGGRTAAQRRAGHEQADDLWKPLSPGLRASGKAAGAHRQARRAKAIRPTISKQLDRDGGIRITLAVAGFAKDELSVTDEDRQLVIRGRQAEARRQNVPSPRHCGATIFAQLRAGGRHRSHICRVGKWIVEDRFGPPADPAQRAGDRDQDWRLT